MGNTRWSADDWDSYSRTTQTKTQSQIFASGVTHELEPVNFTIRESVDSDANPKSTPIIISVDVTGSMGYLAEEIVKRGLGVIMKEIYDRKPVTDPHIMCAANGDGFTDSHPIQATQFEAGVDALTSQVEQIYLEGYGGGNGGESYLMTWYLAANRTSCDSQTKRGKKGYIFTIGDERPHANLPADQIARFFGDGEARGTTAKDLLEALSPDWEVFHLLVGEWKRFDSLSAWQSLLGERAIVVSDHTKLAEVIVSTIQVIEGETVDDVADSWSGDTSLVVRDSIAGLVAKKPGGGTGTGPVRL